MENDVNTLGGTELARAFLKGLRMRKRG